MSEGGVKRAKILRIVDANLNRAGEAGRVVEDCARFIMDHAGLANAAKSLRHRLHAAAEGLNVDAAALLASRDTENDVGTTIVGQDEGKRCTVAHILRANFARLEQSLRVLEEYAKLLGAGACVFEAIRYDSYTLEKHFGSPPERPASLDDKPLMVIVGTSMTPGGTRREVVEVVRKVLAGGGRLIELREKPFDRLTAPSGVEGEMPDAECLALARELRELTAEAGALLIINDRVDVARASGADGVHLGLNDLPIEDARRILGPSRLIGLTAHSLDELADAENRGADYIGIGTMFSSATKPDLEVKCPAELIPAAARCSVPCYAIGGISRDHIDELLELGATRIAVGAAITASANPAAETKWFVSRART